MPEEMPDYPHHSQVLAYLRDFAATYSLREQISTSTEVVRAQPDPHDGWKVTLKGGETRRYDNLICANGTTWSPNRPELEGEFSGEVIHSSEYRSTDTFSGRRVLVVGAGNSGVDIACDAAQAADTAWISMRRGYHFIPKHMFGTPVDVLAETGPQPPMRVAQRILPLLIRLQVGRQDRYGLPKPDHKLFESHPIVNTQILHHLSHGDIAVKPDVERLDGDGVAFADGSRESVDRSCLRPAFSLRSLTSCARRPPATNALRVRLSIRCGPLCMARRSHFLIPHRRLSGRLLASCGGRVKRAGFTRAPRASP
jgi:cation diffusion facilitator CzcD-associated flavoprotein CzcO